MIKGQWIDYEDQRGYFAFPENAETPLPAIIVIQEIGGVNNHIEDVTRRFAAAGYAALAPDLFVVDGKRHPALTPDRIKKAMGLMRLLPPGGWTNQALRDAELAKLPETDRLEITETFGQLLSNISRLPELIPHLRKAVHHLRNVQPETRQQKVACVGFCMGGGLSALLACEEPEISGAAIFYGNTPPVEKISSIQCPVIGFYGANDQRVISGIPAFEEALQKAGKSYERFIYEGANHAFFNDDAQSYNVKAVRDSFVKLLNFFYKTLS